MNCFNQKQISQSEIHQTQMKKEEEEKRKLKERN
jgi:hypothetical protein